MGGKSQNYITNFFSKIKIEPSGCWRWTAKIQSKGYGGFNILRVSVLAHRVSYEIYNGKIPKGLTIDHLCRNRWCVNPQHLEAVTCRENILRGVGTAAINAKKTHCIRGHELSGNNLYARKDRNERGCRICRNLSAKKCLEGKVCHR